MYREWMATMERRVNNLQVTNEELQVKLCVDRLTCRICCWFFLDVVKRRKSTTMKYSFLPFFFFYYLESFQNAFSLFLFFPNKNKIVF